MQKVRVPRRVRRIGMAAAALFVLLLGAGVAYTWFMDQQPAHIATATASDITSYTPITPKQPAPNAPEGVSLQLASTPVAIGDQASVSIRTNPTSTCKIAVIYKYDYSKVQTPLSDPALAPQTADAYGSASWTWTVASAAAVGPAKATVTCAYGGHTAGVQADIDVTK